MKNKIKKNIFFFLCFVVIFSSLDAFAAKRKIYITAGTYAFSNSDTTTIETTIWVTNPSSVSQTVYFDNLRMIVYAAGYFNSPQAWYHAWTVSYAAVWTTFNASGHNASTGTAYVSSKTSPVTLSANQTLELRLCAKPYLQTANMGGAFLGDSDFSFSHYAQYYGGGSFTGNILLQGVIEVEDVTTPGFVIGNASIVKPNNVAGVNGVLTYDFALNAGKPF